MGVLPTVVAEAKADTEAREITASPARKRRSFGVDGLIVGTCLKKVLTESREEAE